MPLARTWRATWAPYRMTRASSSLRLTIDELARSLKRAKTHVVACYNYTGTPYAENQILPEVVYAYGLREAIDAGYLKRCASTATAMSGATSLSRLAVDDFLAAVGEARHERMRPSWPSSPPPSTN